MSQRLAKSLPHYGVPVFACKLTTDEALRNFLDTSGTFANVRELAKASLPLAVAGQNVGREIRRGNKHSRRELQNLLAEHRSILWHSPLLLNTAACAQRLSLLGLPILNALCKVTEVQHELETFAAGCNWRSYTASPVTRGEATQLRSLHAICARHHDSRSDSY